MNSRTSLILLAALVAMSLVVYFTERPGKSAAAQSAGRQLENRVLELNPEDILQVQVKRDFWNSYTLSRGSDGIWRLIDPSDEPAAAVSVQKLLDAVTALPALTTIDLPQDDSERHRQYGLWKPSLELTLSKGNGTDTLTFGTQTEDGKGIYCARVGRDKVYVIPLESFRILSQDLSVYRQEKAQASP